MRKNRAPWTAQEADEPHLLLSPLVNRSTFPSSLPGQHNKFSNVPACHAATATAPRVGIAAAGRTFRAP